MRNHRSNRSFCRRVPSRCQAFRRTAFTLLELLLVLAILVVIGGIAVVNLTGVQKQANADATRTQLDSIEQAIQMFQIRVNSLPETLEALRDGPSDSTSQAKFGDPILNESDYPLTDGWGNELVYSVNGNQYEIRSGGADGQMNTEDDIVLEGS